MERTFHLKFDVKLFERKHWDSTLEFNFKTSLKQNYQIFEVTHGLKLVIIEDQEPFIPMNITMFFRLCCRDDRIPTSRSVKSKRRESKNDNWTEEDGNENLLTNNKNIQLRVRFHKKEDPSLVAIIDLKELTVKTTNNIYKNPLLISTGKSGLIEILASSGKNIEKVSETIASLNQKYKQYKIKIKHICFVKIWYHIYYQIKKNPVVMGVLVE